LFGGRRIYARVFRSQIDHAVPKRLGRGVMLPGPNRDEVRRGFEGLGHVAVAIESGNLALGSR
jgi:hypothetical protein